MGRTLRQKREYFNRMLKKARAEEYELAELATHLSVSTSSVWRWLHGWDPVSTRIDDLISRMEDAGYADA